MRILVISNNAFHLTSSNGRTLGSLLSEIDKKDLMQFCLSGNSISNELLSSCYRISDPQMLHGFFKNEIHAVKLSGKITKELDNRLQADTRNLKKKRQIKRSALTMLIRESIWKQGIRKTDFMKIADDFNPDLVIYQMGDNAFLVELAMWVAQRCHAKVVVYTTEDYYFKTWDYFRRKDRAGILYKIFHRKYQKSIIRLFRTAKLLIANTPELAWQYENEFDVPTKYIMASASNFSETENYGGGHIVYAGGLGLNRHKSLIEIARVLKEMDFDLDLYGTGNDEVMYELGQETNINLKGFVDYETVKSRMKSARLIIHAESFDEFYRKDCRSAFSTKIPDCLACGVPLFLYAPEDMAVTKYLISEENAFVCCKKQLLKDILKSALNDCVARSNIVQKAKECSEKNHNFFRNSMVMKNYLEDILKDTSTVL